MMRKRSIISLLLAFCLCFSLAVPTLALDTEFAVEENSEISLLSEMQNEDFII